jgi:CRP-like cAMP-binding protein
MPELSALNNHPILEHCSDETKSKLSEKSSVLPPEKGEIIFLNGDPAQNFYIITRGWVKLYRETLDGAQAVTDILTIGHMLGDAGLFDQGVYPYNAEAAEPAQLVAYPLDILQQEVERNPKVAIAMLKSMTAYRKQVDQELEHRTLQNAPQRIGCFLLRLANQHQGGSVKLHLPYDKTLLASRLGMQPETFSRALSRLRKETGIAIDGATIEMESIEQLSSYSCSACSSEFPCKDLKIPSF